MSDAKETQEVADAHVTLDLVHAAGLRLAAKTLAFVEEHAASAGANYVVLADVIESAGFEWHVQASYGVGHKFVSVQGEPRPTQQGMVSIETFARIQGNAQAAWSANVPRAWIELAARAAEEPGL